MTSETEQTIGVLPRIDRILQLLASGETAGWRLADLADRTGIARPTVHRLLQGLVDVGYATQLPDRRYSIGPALFWLGLAAPPALPNLPVVRSLAQSLASAVGDTVYVSLREADGVRYVIRVEGDFPIRSHVVSVGQTMPFTASYSGLAMLASMPAPVREHSLNHIVVDPSGEWSHQPSSDAMRDAVRQVALRGWCTGTGLVMPGVSGLAAPIPRQHGTPIAALSISAVESRLSPARADQLAPMLLTTAQRIGRVISASA